MSPILWIVVGLAVAVMFVPVPSRGGPPVAEGIANFVAKLLLAWGILFGGFYLFH
jgi:hypothetical protein